MLAWHPEQLALPEELDGALDSGIANIAWARIRIDAQISFMLEFAKGWKELPAEAVTRLLGDPWEFRAFVDSLQKHSASSAIEAIPHFVFPESFEPIFSWRIKDKIVHAYEGSRSAKSARFGGARTRSTSPAGTAATGRRASRSRSLR